MLHFAYQTKGVEPGDPTSTADAEGRSSELAFSFKKKQENGRARAGGAGSVAKRAKMDENLVATPVEKKPDVSPPPVNVTPVPTKGATQFFTSKPSPEYMGPLGLLSPELVVRDAPPVGKEKAKVDPHKSSSRRVTFLEDQKGDDRIGRDSRDVPGERSAGAVDAAIERLRRKISFQRQRIQAFEEEKRSWIAIQTALLAATPPEPAVASASAQYIGPDKRRFLLYTHFAPESSSLRRKNAYCYARVHEHLAVIRSIFEKEKQIVAEAQKFARGAVADFHQRTFEPFKGRENPMELIQTIVQPDSVARVALSKS